MVSGQADHRPEILAELEGLRSDIRTIQTEIAAVRHPRATEDRILAATQELDAIVEATEGATNRILAIAEEIDGAAADLPNLSDDPKIAAQADKIGELVAGLFTECAFQDITGQRVNKVIRTLNFVEGRIGRIIDLFGEEFEHVPVPDDSGDDDARLLNGPQQKNQGVSQSDIDSLFD